MTVDTKKYLDFVAGVTSMPSQDSAILQARIDELVANGADCSSFINCCTWSYC